MIQFVATVEQFAQLAELKDALLGIREVIDNTKTLIDRWTAKTHGLGVYNHAFATFARCSHVRARPSNVCGPHEVGARHSGQPTKKLREIQGTL